MSTQIIKKLESVKNSFEYSDKIIYDTGSEMESATESEIDAWLDDVGSSWDELKTFDFSEFCDACIDAINGDYIDLNKMLGLSRDNQWDLEDIVSRFEKITNIDLDKENNSDDE